MHNVSARSACPSASGKLAFFAQVMRQVKPRVRLGEHVALAHRERVHRLLILDRLVEPAHRGERHRPAAPRGHLAPHGRERIPLQRELLAGADRRLEHLDRRVVPPHVAEQIPEIVARAHHRRQVVRAPQGRPALLGEREALLDLALAAELKAPRAERLRRVEGPARPAEQLLGPLELRDRLGPASALVRGLGAEEVAAGAHGERLLAGVLGEEIEALLDTLARLVEAAEGQKKAMPRSKSARAAASGSSPRSRLRKVSAVISASTASVNAPRATARRPVRRAYCTMRSTSSVWL